MNKADVVRIINQSKANQYFIDATNFYLVSANKDKAINLDTIYKQLTAFLKEPYNVIK